jgi:CBS domain containing-hemolysin-like protein
MDRVSALCIIPLLIQRTGCSITASRSILRLLGVRETSQQEILTDVEIEGLVEESAEHGEIEEGQAEYIQNVFRFGELEVSDVMVHRTNMITINADDKPEDIVNAVIASPVTRLPLWRGNPENIVGIMHVKDLLRTARGRRRGLQVDVAPPDAALVRAETRPVSEQLKAFRRRKTPFALVVDEYGEVEGLVDA